MRPECESQRPLRMNATVSVSAPPFKRRWVPRFGLRTLLILVTLFGAGFGYLGHLYRRVHHQRQIVAKIQEVGGEVRYGWQIFGKSDTGRMPKPPGPALLRWIFGDDVFAYVELVDFNRFSHPTEPLNPKVLDELPRLRSVMLVGPQVNDEWLKCVSNIRQLK